MIPSKDSVKYTWYEVNEGAEYTFVSEDDQNSDSDKPIYDAATILFNDGGRGTWSVWWTSADNLMTFGDSDGWTTMSEAMKEVVRVYEEQQGKEN